MTHPTISRRLAKIESRHRNKQPGTHRLTDDELDGLLAWLKAPDEAQAEWAVGVLQREGLIP